jgi:hypothetical protein
MAAAALLLGSAAAGAQPAPLAPGAPLPRAVETPRSASPALQLEWKDLLPADERDQASLAPPAPLHDYLLGEDGPAARQPTNSRVNAALDGRTVRLPGFIVPLEIDAEGRVTEMFLVPFFGACIHVPPPAPNQIVYVVLAEPLELGSMSDAYWVTGRMQASSRSTRLGRSAYVVNGATTEMYRF